MPKIKFRDLSGWLKLAVVYVYIEMVVAALAVLFFSLIFLLMISAS